MSKKTLLTRREFLKIAGIASGGAALTGSIFSQMFALSEKAVEVLKQGAGKETWRNTVCRLCPAGCSISIRRIDGIPIGLKGNPLSPINRGGTCPAAFANLEILYHPDRYVEPLARPEGLIRKDLIPISWDEALTSITNKINDLFVRNQSYKIAIINGDDTPVQKEIWQNFANAIGTPNFYQEEHSGLNDNSSFMCQGIREIPKLDLINSECIISLGANFLEEDGAPVHFNQVYSQFKDLENITRNKLIYVGPRANITATSAHRWLPIKPDTWGTLALGIAHILIVGNKVDSEYIRKFAKGYSDWTDKDGKRHLGFESQVRTDFHPKKVEELTGVSEMDIHYLADLLVTRENCVVLHGSEAARSPRGDLHQWAIHCLNFIAGNIQRKGGWYFSGNSSAPKIKSVPYSGKEVINLFISDVDHPLEKPSLDIFAKRVEGYSPYPIELLIINNANPAYFGENRTKWKATLKHIPRVVFIGDLPNETSAYSDVILPTNSPFESWDLVEDIPSIPIESAVLQRPVIEPMYNTLQSYDILKAIVTGIEDSKIQIFPAENSKKLVQTRLQKIHSEKRGSLFAEHSYKDWKETYKQHKQVNHNLPRKKFMKTILKVGGWWDTSGFGHNRISAVLKTASGKFELLNPILTHFEGFSGDDSQLLADLLAGKEYPKALLRFATSGEEGFPLTLVSGFPNTNPFGRTVYSPTMLETVGILREMYWESWLEIHPETAHKYNVRDGEIIRLDSQVGAIHVRARVRPIIRPEVIFIPLGLGRKNVGRFGSGIGSDPRELMVPQPEINTGNMIVSGTPVRITRG